MSDYTPPPPPPPYGSGGSNPPPPPPPGGGYPGGGGYPPGNENPAGGGYQQGGYQPGGYQQGGPYQGGPGGPGYPGGPGGPGYPGSPGYPPGGAPPKKKNNLPLILGCGGCGLLIVLALVVFGAIGYFGRKAGEHGGGSDSTAVAGDQANTTLFTASEDGLTENLRQYYVPFSFRYPSDWVIKERGDQDGAVNFVKVEKGSGGNTAENFAVGYLTVPEGHETDRELLGQLFTQLEQQFSQSFPNFHRVGDDHLTIDGHQATGFRFTAKQGEVEIFGRTLLMPLGNGKGLSLVMLGTPVNSGLTSVDDLGEKGGIPTILRSFRVGENAEGANATAPPAAETPAEGTATDTPSAEGSTDATPADATPADDSEKPSDDSPPAEQGEPEVKEIKPLRP